MSQVHCGASDSERYTLPLNQTAAMQLNLALTFPELVLILVSICVILTAVQQCKLYTLLSFQLHPGYIELHCLYNKKNIIYGKMRQTSSHIENRSLQNSPHEGPNNDSNDEKKITFEIGAVRVFLSWCPQVRFVGGSGVHCLPELFSDTGGSNILKFYTKRVFQGY